MRYYIISVLAVLVVFAVVGCNPVGMDDTRAYVTGMVYTDSSETVPAEGVGLATVGTMETYVTETDANGVFWIEMQMYADSSGIGSQGSITFGLKAFDELGNEYFYGGSEEFTFTVNAGDTLTMYSINRTMIGGSN